jgi:flagellar hook protein FlgE
MQDPFITAINTQKAALGWFQSISVNMSNIYTPGFRERRSTFMDFVNGVQWVETSKKSFQGSAIPGREPTNLMIEGKGFFMVRKPDNSLLFTRMGDFTLNGDGVMVNTAGHKVQGYLLGEDGQILDTGDSEKTGGANNPTHSAGGPGHIPTTEISLWVDPSNGKFFGKYDEYKVKSDGTVVGVADKGKTTVPLYKLAIAGFINPEGLAEPQDNMFVPTELSGLPVEGEGEVRSGFLEKSNVLTREQVDYLRQAKFMMDVSAKLVSTNKTLLEEALRLIQ